MSLATAEAIVGRLKAAVESTRTEEVVGSFGAFAGVFALDERRLLVASTDGVGSKLVLARRAGTLRWAGADLVAHCVNDVLRISSSNNRCSDPGLRDHPGERDLCRLDLALSCKLHRPVGNAEIGVAIIKPMRIIIRLCPKCFAPTRARSVSSQEAPGQRTPGQKRDAFGLTQRNHLAFFFAIDEVVMVLHRYKPGTA